MLTSQPVLPPSNPRTQFRAQSADTIFFREFRIMS